MQKKHIVTAVVAAVVVAVTGGVYVGHGMHYQTRFLPQSKLLGVDVGGQTVEAANKQLQRHFGKTSYRLKEDGKTLVTATAAQLGLKQDFTKQLDQRLARQNPWGFTAYVEAAEGKGTTVDDLDALTRFAKQTAEQLNAERTAPENAKVVSKDGAFVIEPEETGNQINPKKLAQALVAAVEDDAATVDLKQTYAQPTVKKDSKELKQEVTALEKYAKVVGQLKIQNQVVTIPQETLESWLGYADGAVQVNEELVAEYVNGLGNQYNTINKARQFQSTKRGTVTVPSGTYGWSIQTKPTTATIIKAVKAGRDFTEEVSHAGSGYREDGQDIGNTYIEVDIQNQHEYYYQDGKLVMDSPVVTGKPNKGNATPPGVNYLWRKSRNETLRGKNDDGSNYASKVSYWMPIDYTGVGLHDSPWQPKYGGDWYKTHGSHGCVNNPPAFIAKLYDAVAEGTPVIVF